jgi:pyridoxal phosphate enzyme (YggS family)
MATTSDPVQARIQAVRERIETACARTGRRADSVTLVAVSKTFPAGSVRSAAESGQRHFGENYVQEGVRKVVELAEAGSAPGPVWPLVWHFIGPIQSNKTRPIAQHFQWVHSIDREKVAQRLSEQRDPALPPLQACIQVNVSGEASKSGVPPDELRPLALAMSRLPGLRLRGLMAVPEPTPDEALQRRRFAQLRELKERLDSDGLALDTLSMGMSADLEAAIAEGATLVRVGTAIFGNRPGQGQHRDT